MPTPSIRPPRRRDRRPAARPRSCHAAQRSVMPASKSSGVFGVGEVLDGSRTTALVVMTCSWWKGLQSGNASCRTRPRPEASENVTNCRRVARPATRPAAPQPCHAFLSRLSRYQPPAPVRNGQADCRARRGAPSSGRRLASQACWGPPEAIALVRAGGQNGRRAQESAWRLTVYAFPHAARHGPLLGG